MKPLTERLEHEVKTRFRPCDLRLLMAISARRQVSVAAIVRECVISYLDSYEAQCYTPEAMNEVLNRAGKRGDVSG